MQKLSIYSDNIEKTYKAVQNVEGLNESIEILAMSDLAERKHYSSYIVVNRDVITSSLDWFEMLPPYYIKAVEFSPNNLLALIYLKLGLIGHVSSLEQVHPHLLNDIAILILMMKGELISDEYIQHCQSSFHNRAILYHYGQIAQPIEYDTLLSYYFSAVEKGETEELRLYSSLSFAHYLLHNELFAEAENVIRPAISEAHSKEVNMAFKRAWVNVLLSELSMSSHYDTIEHIKTLLQELLVFYEEYHAISIAAEILMDASDMSLLEKKYSEALGYIKKAHIYATDIDFPELIAEADMKKGKLFYTWALDNNPQFFKPAIDAFHQALRVYKEEDFPFEYAEIQNQLGVVYAEMPVEEEKKGIWAAFSASSFKNALRIFTKTTEPYFYGMVSHNYASALMKYPPSKHSDNTEKALLLFDEALAVRSAEGHPLERALTLLNKLELYWVMHNEDKTMEAVRKKKMEVMINEVKELVEDPVLIEKADAHLEALSKLDT